MTRHWIFDLDGTLADSYPLYEIIFREVAQHFQVTMTEEAWKDLPHVVLPIFLEKHFPAEKRNSAFNLVVEKHMARQGEIKIYPGITDVLNHLQSAGCVLSLCTAREQKSAKGLLASTKLDRFFGQIITRDCVPQTKPHPEGIMRLMSSTGTAVHETLMVGDHRMDIEAAKGAGICAVGVSWSRHAHEVLPSIADHHFTSVEEFRRWVIERVPDRKITSL